jgi:hypothetical protein
MIGLNRRSLRYAPLDAAECAAFRKNSRMKFVNATKLDRKSGVAEWRDLRFLTPFRDRRSRGQKP